MSAILDFHIRSKEEGCFTLEAFERGKTQPRGIENQQLSGNDQSVIPRGQPLAQADFAIDLSYMAAFELRQLDFDPKDPYDRPARLRAYGKKLYEKLFTPEIAALWQEMKTRPVGNSDFLTLCLRMAPEARGLEALPWGSAPTLRQTLLPDRRRGL